jgi:hypothetical protein
MNIELHNFISCRSELLVISTDTVAVSSGVIVDLSTLQLWMNDLREWCQCCAQGKDAARRRPRCCAAGKCCRQIAAEWTRHQAWTILQSALSAAVREELVSRNVAASVKVSTPRARRTLVSTVDQSRQFLENAEMRTIPFTSPMYSCWFWASGVEKFRTWLGRCRS